MSVDSDGLSPSEAVGRMATAHTVSLAVRAMATLDLADHLAAGPRTPTLARLPPRAAHGQVPRHVTARGVPGAFAPGRYRSHS